MQGLPGIKKVGDISRVRNSTKLPLLLASDASPSGVTLGAVLLHRLENRDGHLIAFALRLLSAAEKLFTVRRLQSCCTAISIVDTLNICLITNH